MTRAILIALSATSLSSLVACGSSGEGDPVHVGTFTGNQEPATSSNQPAVNSNQPALGSQQPAPNPNQPATNPDQPPSTGTPGGTTQTAFSCSALCASLDPSCAQNCAQWCQLIDPGATLCATEAAALRGCVQHASLRCADGKVRPANDACSDEGTALIDCITQSARTGTGLPPVQNDGSGGSSVVGVGSGGSGGSGG